MSRYPGQDEQQGYAIQQAQHRECQYHAYPLSRHTNFQWHKVKIAGNRGGQMGQSHSQSWTGATPHSFRGRATFHSLKGLGLKGGVGMKARALNTEIHKQKGKFIFTKRNPSQRFQKYTTGKEEPQDLGERTVVNRDQKLKVSYIVQSISS